MMLMLKTRTNYLFFTLACLVAFALFLRIYLLESVPSSLFIDEVWAVYQPYLHRAGLLDLSTYSIASYFLQGTYFVYENSGASILFTRLPAAVYGTLLVAIIFFLANELFNVRVGLLSAMLMALSPWAVIFSRYQVPSISSVFWLTMSAYLLYKGLKTTKRQKQIVFVSLGSLALGLSLNIHAVLRIFIPLFISGCVLLYLLHVKKFDRSIFLKGLTFSAFFSLGALPVILDYIGYSPSALTELSSTRTIFGHASSAHELLLLIGERFYLHFSPDFLVLTGGFSYAGVSGFQPMISAEGLLKYSTGKVGMLNFYGILIYPAVCYLIYNAAKKKAFPQRVLLCWIFCYLLASSIPYYDNPNAARNIIGLPALIISMAVFIDHAYFFISNHRIIKKLSSIFVLGTIIGILLPTFYFSIDYFMAYPVRSAKAFDYGYKEIAYFLTKTDNWKKPIMLYDLPYGGWQLAFYSPQQPTDPSKFIVLSPTFDFALLSPQKAFIQIQNNINFEQGTIEYRARLDKSYGAASSFHVQLVNNDNSMCWLAVYAENSSFNPNGYLLGQKIDDKTYAEERPLNRTVEYGVWYAVKLQVNLTTISFYFDGEWITTWQRPATDKYQYLKLCGESSAVSFSDLKIMFGEDGEFINIFQKNDISDWQILSGAWTFEQSTLKGACSAILILSNASTLQSLQENNIDYVILDTIHYPDNMIAFIIVLINP